jgi:hypothetical protein
MEVVMRAIPRARLVAVAVIGLAGSLCTPASADALASGTAATVSAAARVAVPTTAAPARAVAPVAPFDLNGDGFADLAIGVPGETLGTQRLAGGLNVLPGSTAGPTASGNQFWSQNSAGIRGAAEFADLFGDTVASGDFDQDGHADLAVGVPQEAAGSVSAGAVSVLYGTASGLAAKRNQFWSQDSPGVPGAADGTDAWGSALATGDFDGDGYADLAVGAPNERLTSNDAAGAVTVLYGSPTGLSAARATAWSQASAGVLGASESRDRFGARLAADDLTGDGYADLAIGIAHENDSSGAVQILRGSARGLTATGNQIWSQDSAGVLEAAERWDSFGDALAIGDFNHDGMSDLAVGAPGEILESCPECENQGAVSVLLGTSTGLTATGNQFWHVGSDGLPGSMKASNDFGRALAAGDFDGDGAADLAVAAPKATVDGASGAGMVYLLAGSADGLAGTGRTITQNTPGVPGSAEPGDGTYLQLTAQRYAGGNRDGLAVAYPSEDAGGHRGSGTVVVVPGTASGLDPAHSRSWSQSSAGIRGAAEDEDRFGQVTGDSQVF